MPVLSFSVHFSVLAKTVLPLVPSPRMFFPLVFEKCSTFNPVHYFDLSYFSVSVQLLFLREEKRAVFTAFKFWGLGLVEVRL